MSKNNNVNPGQYKVAGRERPGEDIPAEQNKQRVAQDEHRLREQARKGQKKKPGGRANR